MAPKSILVFCDGTGQDGIIANDIMENNDTTTRSATNVLRLSRAIKPFKKSGGKEIPQIVYYQTGVGTETDFNFSGLRSEGLIQAFGRLVASKIRDVYTFIAQNYEDDDEICLFGYSRGAYTARRVAGLIDRIGLLSRRDLGQFAAIWKELNEGTYNRPSPRRPVKIKCVGVWDTVGSVRTVGITSSPGIRQVIDALSIKDCSLPGCIEYALHGMAFHENRGVFPVTLWDTKGQVLKSGQTLKQVWFGGCHSDVGGGQIVRELADISLFWMAGEIEGFVDLDNDILWASHAKPTVAWGASQPINSFQTELPTRALGAATRLGEFSKNIKTELHRSMESSPTQLRQAQNMITLNSLKPRPDFAKMNKRDQELKDQWVAPPTSGTVAFEEPNALSGLFIGLLGAGLEIVGMVVRGVTRFFT